MLTPPYPDLETLLHEMGRVGRRLDEIGACEGAAGNLSVCLCWEVDTSCLFPCASKIKLPLAVPGLAGALLLVSGSGVRLREIIDAPTTAVACVRVEPGGEEATLHTARDCAFERVTSEFNSHLAAHHDQVAASRTNFHALVHAQPLHLTYLSHIARYQDETFLNTRLLRWQPETILNLPDGIGFVPFHVPGSAELSAAGAESLRRHRLALWGGHGVMARSELSLMRAADLVEYAETAARYEALNLAAGEPGVGLSPDEIRAVCRASGIQQDIF